MDAMPAERTLQTFTVNDRFTIDDRIRMLPGLPASVAAHAAWLQPVLLQTIGAVMRFMRWLLAGALEAPPADRVAVHGEGPRARAAIVRAVERIEAPPVRWHIAQRVLFVLVGDTASGWAGRLPAFPTNAFDAPHLVVVDVGIQDAEELESIVGHEIAHTWLRPISRESFDVDELREPGLPLTAQLATAWNCRGVALEVERDGERQAMRLAHSWGFRGRAADVRCAAEQTVLRGER